MSDFPFSIPRRGDADVVNGVSYAGTTLTLTRAEGSDLTTTIATGDPTKIENGTSSMRITSAAGPCVFTPNDDADLTTTFKADGDIRFKGDMVSGDVTATTTSNSQFGCAIVGYSGWPNEAGFSHSSHNTQEGYALIQDSAGITYINAADSKQINFRVKNVNQVSFFNDGTATFNGEVTAAGVILDSDDRIKENEKLIVNATETLSKLTPQIYDKYRNMDLSGSFQVESGLIAQEVYYNAPELRHLVVVGKDYDASGNSYTPTPEEMDLSGVDIANDPDYGSHGWSKTEKSGLHYQGLIPYLIKSNQEMAERLASLENK